MLTKSQLENVTLIHKLIARDHEIHLEMDRASTGLGYKYWESKEWRAAQKKMSRNHSDIKNAFHVIVLEWAKSENVEVFVRSELNYYDGKLRDMGMTSIYNSKGGMPDGKTRWLNKISCNADGTIVTHKARTDPKFLSPLDIKFSEFIKEFANALGCKR